MQFFYTPIIQIAVGYKFQCADGVGNIFNRIALTVGKIVHGINAPFISRTVMFGMFYSIEYGIAHNHVGRCHINFCP